MTLAACQKHPGTAAGAVSARSPSSSSTPALQGGDAAAPIDGVFGARLAAMAGFAYDPGLALPRGFSAKPVAGSPSCLELAIDAPLPGTEVAVLSQLPTQSVPDLWNKRFAAGETVKQWCHGAPSTTVLFAAFTVSATKSSDGNYARSPIVLGQGTTAPLDPSTTPAPDEPPPVPRILSAVAVSSTCVDIVATLVDDAAVWIRYEAGGNGHVTESSPLWSYYLPVGRSTIRFCEGQPGKVLRLRAFARNLTSQSALSGEYTVSMPENAPPAQPVLATPQVLSATIVANSPCADLRVSQVPGASIWFQYDVGNGVTAWEYYVPVGSDSIRFCAGRMGRIAKIWAYAKNASGQSGLSSVVSLLFPPPVPQSFAATPISPNCVKLTIAANSEFGTYVHYNIGQGFQEWKYYIGPGQTSIDFCEATPGAVAQFNVFARAYGIDSANTNDISVTMPASTPAPTATYYCTALAYFYRPDGSYANVGPHYQYPFLGSYQSTVSYDDACAYAKSHAVSKVLAFLANWRPWSGTPEAGYKYVPPSCGRTVQINPSGTDFYGNCKVFVSLGTYEYMPGYSLIY